jgi:hypothetical protein
MAGFPIDRTGQRFGMLVAEHFLSAGFWLCRCDCGRLKETNIHSAAAGRIKSCGCKTRDFLRAGVLKHGKSYEKIYGIHEQMLARCYNKNNPRYKRYGGRGIKVCRRWHSFANFYADMGDRPENKTLDRRDNDGDYKPANCRWASAYEQSNNKHTSRKVKINGRVQSMAQWAREYGLNRGTVYSRFRGGIRGKELIQREKIRAFPIPRSR